MSSDVRMRANFGVARMHTVLLLLASTSIPARIVLNESYILYVSMSWWYSSTTSIISTTTLASIHV